MPHSFRFEPPPPPPGSILRRRLMRQMLGRWEHRLTTVVGGPGLGKSTLLAQAIAENRLAPRGADVWLGAQAGDGTNEELGRDLLVAVTGGPAAVERPAPQAVADALWRRAPEDVCVFIDDAHLVGERSPSARWLTDLVAVLPGNAHLVVASRGVLPVPVARLAASGALGRITAEELRFTGEETAGFARQRHVDPAVLESTGGWPAMAELVASVDADVADQYVWEEVLRPLGPRRRRVLAALCTLGGADDALLSAALDEPVTLGTDLVGVPLVAVGPGGWHTPHLLWVAAGHVGLGEEGRDDVLRRAVRHLSVTGRHDDAVGLAADGGLTDVIGEVVRAACVSGVRPRLSELDRWLEVGSPEVWSSPAGALAVALRATLAAPARSPELLRAAARQARDADDPAVELVASANLVRVAWWHRDADLLAEVMNRLAAVSATGEAAWRSVLVIARAVLADLAGDDATVLAELDAVVPGTLDVGWAATATWLAADVRAGRGEGAAALAELASIPVADVSFGLTVEGQRHMIRWSIGETHGTIEALEDLADRVQAAGTRQYAGGLLPVIARLLAHVGDTAGARAFLDRADAIPEADALGRDVALASLQLAEGDEEAASATVRRALDEHPLGAGPERRTWRLCLGLTYVLVPETRPEWDAMDLRGHHHQARRLAAAVVDLREHRHGDRRIDGLDLPPMGVVRSALHHRFLAELAVGLRARGHPAGAAVVESMGAAGRAAVRDLAAAGPVARARSARALLAAVPAPPPVVTDVAVLGPLTLRRAGEVIDDPVLRRERLRALVAFLVAHRHTTRPAIIAALWPDLDERAASNNLRVTLTYLLRLLEPWRPAGDSSFHVRTVGQRIELVTADALRIDADEFDAHLAAAGRAEVDGSPSLALDHHRAAIALYRGDLYADVADAEWAASDRDRYRQRFVAAAVRTSQLLAARGDLDEADAAARRALAADPWIEDAYTVLVTTALARRDRTAARKTLDHCLAVLAELGVGPSSETKRLTRRVTAA